MLYLATVKISIASELARGASSHRGGTGRFRSEQYLNIDQSN